MRRPSE